MHFFKNSRLIRSSILALLLVVSAVTSSRAEDPEFKSLFDGKTLDGWDGDPQFWSVVDGAITGKTTAENPTKGNTFIIYRGNAVAGGTLKDFELRVMFKLGNGNSGVQYRCKDLGDHVIAGYQADIVDDAEHTGICYEERGRGVLALRGQKVTIDEAGKKTTESIGDSKELAKAIKVGDWNQYIIIARGNHLIEQINGQTMCEVIDNEKDKAAREGLLAFQIHVGPPMTIQFKDVRLMELKE